MGKVKHDWQNADGILGMFSDNPAAARRGYRKFVEKGLEQGRRPDLTGGGLLRSAGGWEAVRVLKKENIYQKSDERILGDGNFVSRILASAEEEMEKRYAIRAHGYDVEKIALRVSEVLGVEVGDVWARGRYRRVVEARSLFCYWSVRELGIPMSSLARRLGISTPAVSKCVSRGQNIAKTRGCSLLH